MRKSNQYKLLALLGLGVVLFSYNQCVMNQKSSPSKLKYKQDQSSSGSKTSAAPTNYNTSNQDSVNAFKNSVYLITSTRCVACHGSSQTPLHASNNIQTAHDAVLNSFKVDFNSPENSRLVLKLKNDKHNCWGDCNSNATEMLNAINSWKDKIAYSGTTTAPEKHVTQESSTIKEIIDPVGMAGNGTITIMGEAASLKTPMVLGMESGINFVSIPKGASGGTKTSADQNGGTAIYTLRVSQTDFYKVYLFVNAPDTASNSIFVRANSLDYKDFTIPLTKGFEWREVKVANAEIFFSMQSGKSQTLELKQKEEGVKVSKIIISNDSSFDPAVNQKTTLRGTVSLGLDHLVNDNTAAIEFDIEEYDSYSYRISNLKYTGTKKIKIKTIKFLVNGSYNPQHATYNYIDKVVGPADSIISNNSMIMLKDKGPEADKISISFELIELAP